MKYLNKVMQAVPANKETKEKYIEFCERVIALIEGKITVDQFKIHYDLKSFEEKLSAQNYCALVDESLLVDSIKYDEFKIYHKERFDAAIKGKYDWSKLMFKDFFQNMFMEMSTQTMSRKDWKQI